MAVFSRPRQVLAIAGALGLTLGATACSGSGGDKKAGRPACAAYAQYQGNDGTQVSIYSPIRDTEADLLEESWKQFIDCTGIAIDHEGSSAFEAQLPVRVDGSDPPDLAFIPHGLLERFAGTGKLKAASADTKAMAEQNYSPDWLKYSTVNGTFYGAPLGSDVKSLVWYSPAMFREHGYKVPKTWQDLLALSDQIAGTGIKPWCIGIESDDATGDPATDWIEELMLRTQSPDVYDQWVTHRIPFDHPRVAEAVDRAGSILKNEKYVNGGYGGVKSIVTTSVEEGGLPILQGKCALHHQGARYASHWPQGTRIAADGDVFAFYFPAIDPGKGKPVLGGGEFVAAFTDRPEVRAVQTYLASAEHANSRAKLGNWVSANKGLDITNVADPIDRLCVEILRDRKTVFRFDGSDLMPGPVGAGAFGEQMVRWIDGADTKSALAAIERSWPA